MTDPIKILVVDDEPQIRRLLRIGLESQRYSVVEAEHGRQALEQAALTAPDLVILDLGLPDIDGKQVIQGLRDWSSTPILVLTVRDGEAEKVAALDAGADDYVTKPFGMAELLARVRASLRHRLQKAGEVPAVELAGGVRIDLALRTVSRDGTPVSLTPKEYDLLALLARHAGKVLTHRQLLQDVWGPAHVEDIAYLRVFTRQVRQKLEADPARPAILVTESGVGYRLLMAAT
ncbi:response regulator [Lacibacterium aquatile]|uniref:Response regulator n=1 Tax=Lacibacterium aquatile TaxID=1168082 RepID=A0ABW5DQY4_9PROT